MKTVIRVAVMIAIIIGAVQTIAYAKEGVSKKRALTGKANKSGTAEAAKTKRSEAIEAAKEKREQSRETIANKINERAETRQANQAKRIEHGISKGYLTQDEINKLDVQQKSLESLQQSFSSDGKITKNEAQQLHQELNAASRCIFAEKHDADGKTMPVYRLGKDVTLRNDVAQKLGDENLSKDEARAYLKDFHRMVELKKNLSSGSMSDEDRSKLQNEYNDLLNKYFETK